MYLSDARCIQRISLYTSMIEKAAHSSTYKKKRGLNSVNSKHTDPAASPAVLRLLAVGAVLWSPPRVDQSSLLIGRRHSSQYLHQNLGCYSNKYVEKIL